ncbi:helix-turn-helix protein [Neolewinella xylanilytica]|uniref:Helix-turn-helix protein n=1 Tax=Neolewinella xylanilytica TaxID=1514080 RepID=A0A2S6IBQ3_9BACT|nr:helix-turn-helix transcriptional regulator [Neolewinella xylanilytica]PPK89088.1 helix-turn-helix protein [Neolewinella xylanilytica]
MKKNKEQVYKDLLQRYSEEEVAASFIASEQLPAEAQAEVHREFLEERIKSLQNIAGDQKLRSELFAFKIQLEDYFKADKYHEQYNFGSQLKKYIEIVGRTQTEISNNLSIHKARLSRIINGKENPNPELMYRLQEHSSGAIPAFYWWKLLSKELEYQIRTDKEKMQEESNKVTNPISIRA